MFDGLPPVGRVRGPARPTLDLLDPINRGLIGWWPLDEAAGSLAADISPWRNAGTLTNGPTRIVGAQGRAVNFDGSNDYIAAAGRQDITAFSAVAWLYLSSGATFSHSILSSLFGVDQTILWTTDTYGTQFKFWATTSATNATSSTIPHIRERWVCAGVSWAPGRTTRFYLDGVPIGSGTTAGDLRSPVIGWNVGRYGVPSVWFFPGAMCGVRIWRRVLGEREFARLRVDPWAGASWPDDAPLAAVLRGTLPPIAGELAATFPAPVFTAAGALAIAGSLSATFPAPSFTAAGALAITGSLAATFPAPTFTIAGTGADLTASATRTVRLPARSRGVTLDARARSVILPARDRTVILSPERT